MSVVTDIVLLTAIDDGGIEDEHPNVDLLNNWIQANHGPAETLKKVDQHGGGNKAMQCDVFVGAVNFLDVPGLIEAFMVTPWDMPECAQLLLKEEQEERFKLYQMDWKRTLLVLGDNNQGALPND